MRRLFLLSVFALTACPDWNFERGERCRAIGSTTGACEGTALDAGGSTGGGGGSNSASDGGDFAGYEPISTSSTLSTQGGSALLRRPRLLWEVRRTQQVIVVESAPLSTSLWRSTDFAEASGNTPKNWCASAASDRSTRVAHAVTDVGNSTDLSVDEVDAGNGLNNVSWATLSGCPDALGAYQRPDAGLAFLSMKQGPGSIAFERFSCPMCLTQTFEVPLEFPTIGDTVTDESQTVWVSSSGGSSAQDLFVIRIPPDQDTGIARRFANVALAPQIELSTSGTSLHAAWMMGQTLSIADLSTDGGADQFSSWQFPEQARLVDLVESPRSLVAVLDFGAGRVALLVRRGGLDAFFRLDVPAYRVTPFVAHLGTQLRIAGQCDGGTMCDSPARNPVLEFARLPDGGYW